MYYVCYMCACVVTGRNKLKMYYVNVCVLPVCMCSDRKEQVEDVLCECMCVTCVHV